MKSHIEIKNVYLTCFDGVHKMVHADIVDRLHNIKAEVYEWVDDHNHIDRENSVIIENDIIHADFDTIFDIFDEIDNELDEGLKFELY